MKIIAQEKDDKRQVVYLCEVTHTEIEKFLNEYYNRVATLKRGDTVDLGKGYDFLREAKEALKQTSDFISANEKVIASILSGIDILYRAEAVKEADNA